MPSASARIHINATPEEVFDLVSDPWRIPEYVSFVKEIVEVSEGPPGVGTRIVEKAKPGPFPVTTYWEIVEYEFPHRHVWRGHQVDMEMTLTKEITSEGSGSMYQQFLDYRYLPRFRPLGWLLEKLVITRSLQKSFREIVAGIRQIAELESGSVSNQAETPFETHPPGLDA